MKELNWLDQTSDDTQEILENVKVNRNLRRSRQPSRRARKLFSEKSLEEGRANWLKYKENVAKGLGDNVPFRYDQEIWLECLDRTDELEGGDNYWISKEWEKTGAFVKILEKSTELNRVGLPSLVTVEVVKPVGAYELGQVKTMNATNIYDHREHSSLENFRKKMAGQPYLTPSS